MHKNNQKIYIINPFTQKQYIIVDVQNAVCSPIDREMYGLGIMGSLHNAEWDAGPKGLRTTEVVF